MKHFFKSERGYALVLTLLFMPVFIGISLLVIDIGRGNNAQGDHQAAADALALAGARELDGRTDAITRAKTAMATLDNTVSFLSTDSSTPSIDLIYEDTPGNTFTVIFLDEIPPSDDTQIDQAWVDDHATSDPTEANFVYVYSRSSDLRPFFFNPATRTRQDVPIAARAVATYTNATCDLTPLFICTKAIQGKSGPVSGTAALQDAFARGEFYGRLQKLRFQNGNIPGNFGFLQIDDPGASAMIPYLAGKRYPTCKQDTAEIDTEPGAKASAASGFNTRFDIYDKNGAYSKNGEYSPATLVRKGFVGTTCEPKEPANTAQWRSAVTFSDDVVSATSPTGWSWNFDGTVQVANPYAAGPAKCEKADYPPYWSSIYGTALTKDDYAKIITHPAMLTALAAATAKEDFPTPSRYDVYKYEAAQIAAGNLSPLPGLAEKGNPVCYSGSSSFPNTEERRTLYVAMVDCDTFDVKGRVSGVPVELYAKVFLPSPIPAPGSKTCAAGGLDPLVMEISDISGPKGNGSVELFLRQEAYLVR